jgi:hypothetical protein
MGNNGMMRCVTKNKSSIFAPKLKASKKKKKENQMFWQSKKKFQVFLKQEILIPANIEKIIFIFLEFESTF